MLRNVLTDFSIFVMGGSFLTAAAWYQCHNRAHLAASHLGGCITCGCSVGGRHCSLIRAGGAFSSFPQKCFPTVSFMGVLTAALAMPTPCHPAPASTAGSWQVSPHPQHFSDKGKPQDNPWTPRAAVPLWAGTGADPLGDWLMAVPIHVCLVEIFPNTCKKIWYSLQELMISVKVYFRPVFFGKVVLLTDDCYLWGNDCIVPYPYP